MFSRWYVSRGYVSRFILRVSGRYYCDKACETKRLKRMDLKTNRRKKRLSDIDYFSSQTEESQRYLGWGQINVLGLNKFWFRVVVTALDRRVQSEIRLRTWSRKSDQAIHRQPHRRFPNDFQNWPLSWISPNQKPVYSSDGFCSSLQCRPV